MEAKNENIEKGTSVIGSVLGMLDKYGVWKVLLSCIVMVFMSYCIYISFNPGFLFERYDKYVEQKHEESFKKRLNSTPVVQSMLDNLLTETNANRASIIEMHNGTYNASGLSFNYGSLTYERLRNVDVSIKEDFDDFTLERFPIFLTAHNQGFWQGTREDAECIDKRMELKMESNDTEYMVMYMIYGVENEIGFLSIAYTDSTYKDLNLTTVNNTVNKYASRISPYLDGSLPIQK